MTNPSENPSSPPKESSPTSSTTPTSKKGRFKMLARKTVAGSELSKILDEKLKVSQAEEPQKSEESFKVTRSKRKQGEVELERALEESKIKADAKGKKKVNEPVEAIEIAEMNQVLHDEDEAEEVEVVTPKAKKRKTSKKKSPSKPVDTEPSALAKRTRSATKSRKVQVVEEEESEQEEETDEE
nr:sister chromatid cohesion protein PDS5 homolog B-like [Nicotiana tomentosiformis]